MKLQKGKYYLCKSDISTKLSDNSEPKIHFIKGNIYPCHRYEHLDDENGDRRLIVTPGVRFIEYKSEIFNQTIELPTESVYYIGNLNVVERSHMFKLPNIAVYSAVKNIDGKLIFSNTPKSMCENELYYFNPNRPLNDIVDELKMKGKQIGVFIDVVYGNAE